MMFGPQTKSVMVVYPKGYYDVATSLKHAISKHNSLDSTLWTIEQYQQNLPTLSGKSHVIFLGAEKDCPFAKPFHDQVESVTFHHGACYAVDGPKALVYGLDVATLEKFVESGPDKNYVDFDGAPIRFAPEPVEAETEPEESAATWLGRFGKAGWGALSGASALVGGLASAPVTARAAEKVKNMWSASDQRVENTKIASKLFLERGLYQWLGLDQESVE
jgi:hypothetical protein